MYDRLWNWPHIAAAAPPAKAEGLPAVQNPLKKYKSLSPDEIFELEPRDLAMLICILDWPNIKTPAREGTRWCTLLRQLEAQEVTRTHVAEEVMRKQQRDHNALQLREAKAKAVFNRKSVPQSASRWKAPPGWKAWKQRYRKDCQLYRPQRPANSTSSGPRPTRKRAPTLPSMAPSNGLSDWARAQVSQIFKNAKATPRLLWYMKEQMRRFHPDKKLARDHLLASRSDEEVTMVFMAIKRMYTECKFH